MRGLFVATALPYTSDLSVDFDAYGEHVRWLIENGCDGVVPNGSLGEYQVLTADERARVMTTAIEAGANVVPGVSAYGSREARHWAERAAEAGCQEVMLLPPNAYRANDDAVVAHFREVAAVGLPIIAYNNPIDTKVDLTPALLDRLYGEGLIAGVKEFTGDVRRGYQMPAGLDLIVGSDDVVLELAIAGAVGWIAGIPNALPVECVALWHASVAGAIGRQRAQRSEARGQAAGILGHLDTALPAYRALHPLLRWDSKVEFVQAIKLAMDLCGRYGGPCRPPRSALTTEQAAIVTEAVTLARKG